MASGQEISEGPKEYSMAKLVKPLKPPLTPQEQKQKEEAFSKDIMDTMTTSMMMVIGMIVFLPMILKSFGSRLGIRQAQTLTYTGRTDHRELQAISVLKWIDLIADPPYTAWVHCFIINDGPGVVEIAVNHPNDKFVMGPGETRTIDRTGAEEQILSLFYIAEPGQIANLRVTGEY